MSHKYDVPFLRRRALSHLSHRCPTTLHDFVTQHRNKAPLPSEALEVLKTVLKIDASWILPYQFLVTYFTDLETLLAIQPWKDLELEIQAMCHVKWRRIETYSRSCIAELLRKLLSDLCTTCAVLGVQFQRIAVVALSKNIPNVFSTMLSSSQLGPNARHFTRNPKSSRRT